MCLESPMSPSESGKRAIACRPDRHLRPKNIAVVLVFEYQQSLFGPMLGIDYHSKACRNSHDISLTAYALFFTISQPLASWPALECFDMRFAPSLSYHCQARRDLVWLSLLEQRMVVLRRKCCQEKSVLSEMSEIKPAYFSARRPTRGRASQVSDPI